MSHNMSVAYKAMVAALLAIQYLTMLFYDLTAC